MIRHSPSKHGQSLFKFGITTYKRCAVECISPETNSLLVTTLIKNVFHATIIVQTSTNSAKVVSLTFPFFVSVQTIDPAAAETVKSQIIHLLAFGNTQSHEAVKYLVPIVLKKGASPERLRLAAVYSLSRLIDEDDSSVLENLGRILADTSESRKMRLAAYDVLIGQGNLDSEDLEEVDQVMLHDEHLRNYHVSTIQSLKALNSETPAMRTLSGIDGTAVSPTLSSNQVLDIGEHMEIVRSILQAGTGSSLIKGASVFDDDYPGLIRYEMFDRVGHKSVAAQGVSYSVMN